VGLPWVNAIKYLPNPESGWTKTIKTAARAIITLEISFRRRKVALAYAISPSKYNSWAPH
jgi:hypothetical protein